MTKTAALHAFFSSFGITAYPTTDPLTEAEFPYLTYTPVVDVFGNKISLTVNLWYLTESESEPNAKAQEISDRLPCYQTYDGGAILFDRGSPFSQSLTDETNPNIKRRYINISAEYISMR